VSVINPNETSLSWRPSQAEHGVQLYLSSAEGDPSALLGTKIAGFPLNLSITGASDWISPDDLTGASAAVIEVDTGSNASIKRFQQLAEKTRTPLIAAAYEPPLALVRSLIRAGAHDVIPLPLSEIGRAHV